MIFLFMGKGAFSREVAFERRDTVRSVFCVTLVSSLFFYKIKDDLKKNLFCYHSLELLYYNNQNHKQLLMY